MIKLPLKNLSGLLLIALTLTGCDLFDKVDDVTFEGKLPVHFVVNEEMISETPVVYSKTEILDALDDAEIAKYKNKIKEIKLNRVTYKIENFVAPGEVTFNNGSLKVGPSEKTLATATSVILYNTAETEFDNIDLDGFNDFARQIKDDKQVQINLSGSLSNTPAAFTLTAYFYVTVTADVLK